MSIINEVLYGELENIADQILAEAPGDIPPNIHILATCRLLKHVVRLENRIKLIEESVTRHGEDKK